MMGEKSTLKIPFNRVREVWCAGQQKNNQYTEVQVRGLNYICHIDSKCKITKLKKWY
jgi:hypothetical protein